MHTIVTIRFEDVDIERFEYIKSKLDARTNSEAFRRIVKMVYLKMQEEETKDNSITGNLKNIY